MNLRFFCDIFTSRFLFADRKLFAPLAKGIGEISRCIYRTQGWKHSAIVFKYTSWSFGPAPCTRDHDVSQLHAVDNEAIVESRQLTLCHCCTAVAENIIIFPRILRSLASPSQVDIVFLFNQALQLCCTSSSKAEGVPRREVQPSGRLLEAACGYLLSSTGQPFLGSKFVGPRSADSTPLLPCVSCSPADMSARTHTQDGLPRVQHLAVISALWWVRLASLEHTWQVVVRWSRNTSHVNCGSWICTTWGNNILNMTSYLALVFSNIHLRAH